MANMKPRHAAALTPVGWYLMMPPFYEKVVRATADLSVHSTLAAGLRAVGALPLSLLHPHCQGCHRFSF